MLTDILKIAWLRKKNVISLTFVFLVLVFAALLIAKLTYEATAVIRIMRLTEPTSGLTHDDSLQDKLAFIETHKQMLTSRVVLTRLIHKLPFLLDWVKEDGPYREELVIRKLEKSIIVHSIRFTDLLTVSVRAYKKSEVAPVTNGLVEIYQEWLNEETGKSYESVSRFLVKRLQHAKKELSRDEDDIQAYKKRHEVVSLPAEIQARLNTVNRLEIKVADQDAKIEYFKEILSKIKNNKGSLLPYVGLTNNDAVKELAHELRQTELKINTLEKYLRKKHPLYPDLKKREKMLYTKLHLQLAGIFESKILAVEVSRAKTQNELESYRQNLYKLREVNLGLEKLDRKFRTDEKTYLSLLKKHEESEILKAKQSLVEVLVISPAIEPIKHILPKRKLTLMLGIALGFLVALSVVVVRERWVPEWSFNASKPESEPSL